MITAGYESAVPFPAKAGRRRVSESRLRYSGAGRAGTQAAGSGLTPTRMFPRHIVETDRMRTAFCLSASRSSREKCRRWGWTPDERRAGQRGSRLEDRPVA